MFIYVEIKETGKKIFFKSKVNILVLFEYLNVTGLLKKELSSN